MYILEEYIINQVREYPGMRETSLDLKSTGIFGTRFSVNDFMQAVNNLVERKEIFIMIATRENKEVSRHLFLTGTEIDFIPSEKPE